MLWGHHRLAHHCGDLNHSRTPNKKLGTRGCPEIEALKKKGLPSNYQGKLEIWLEDQLRTQGARPTVNSILSGEESEYTESEFSESDFFEEPPSTKSAGNPICGCISTVKLLKEPGKSLKNIRQASSV